MARNPDDNNADAASEEKSSIHVVDRRRFASDGAERQQHGGSDAGRVAPGDGDSAAETQGQPVSTGISEGAEQSAGEVSFMSFLMSLATQALVQLGEMAPPPGMEIPIDRVAAQQTIDILSMLQKKTAGNLSADEARFFEEVLHSLRMSYVRSSR